MHSTPYPCPQSHCAADKFGDHQVGCGGNSDRISRHNALRDVLFTAAQSGALALCREASGVISDSLRRPANILLPTWHQGRSAALDVHIISPLQQLTLAAYTPGHALEVGVRRKVAANLPSCRSAGVDFIPIVAGTLGGLAEDTISTISTLGMAISQRVGPTTDDDSSPAIRQLFNKYAVTLWRGNATLWMHRLPPVHPSVDGVI